MDLFTIITLLFFSYIFILAISTIFGLDKPENLPPGPTRLPIIGNLHLLGDRPHLSLAKLAKIHGPIMSLKLGQITTVVISSATAEKEVLQKQDLSFSNRHVPDALHAHNHNQYSVAWLPVCTEWRTLRRFLNSSIFSTNSLESNQHLRSQKVEELVAYCQKASLSNEYVDIGRAVFRTSLNLLSNTVFSKDLTDPYEEDSGREFKEVFGEIMVEVGKPNLVDYFPVLKRIDPQGIRRRLGRHFGKVLEIFEELIEDRLRMGRLKQEDVLDVCLGIIQDTNKINRTQMKTLFLDLFAAGTDTTSSTLEWAMTEVVRNPHIMAKAKEELKQVLGKGTIVREHDISRLPYLSCIVKETLRLHPAVPLLLPRTVGDQVELEGYTIPGGTQVLVNAWAIGRDSATWDDPLEFKPERFLESEVDARGQDFELIPFGSGRRICPGLPLAMRMIPVMLGSLLNNFVWNLDVKIQHEGLDMTEKFGITLCKAKPLCVVPKPLD